LNPVGLNIRCVAHRSMPIRNTPPTVTGADIADPDGAGATPRSRDVIDEKAPG
jgi:hypothetical protein